MPERLTLMLLNQMEQYFNKTNQPFKYYIIYSETTFSTKKRRQKNIDKRIIMAEITWNC